ncbi:COMMD10 [Acanthosepion pharaonis]|uniref:COMMD10 n=1 Tax=Acanthosepion pharaonis TaxID=158019 RepID=A0A812DTS8_ACAPH|nr:COMMD10 [Sepia pharaonis]
MFSNTTSIKKAVGFINELDSKLFMPLLSRILQKIHLKDERSFTEEEEEKLQSTFNLPANDLELLLETLEFFLQQAAYHLAKPAVLTQQLLSLDINEDKVNIIVEAWTTHAKNVLQKLGQRTLAPNQLSDINWRLNLEMANMGRSKMKLPNAMFELKVTQEDMQQKEKIHLEFSHDELYAFYNQLETIQRQIDNLD